MAAVSDYLRRTLSAFSSSTTGDLPSNSPCGSSRSARTLPTPRFSYTCGDTLNEHALETEIRYIYHSLPNQKRHGKLTVTPNLHDARLQIQRSGLTGYLWVDAKCINQSISEERSQQANIMCKNYENASRILIWLGKEDKSAPVMISLV
jgi:Heterokaryon incompatibility protein (HET)